MKIEIKSSILFKIIKISTTNRNYEELSCFLLEVEKDKIIFTASKNLFKIFLTKLK